jgi:predicted kinase
MLQTMNDKRPSSPTLVIVCGLSFAGKTTLADALCRRFGCSQVDVDVTKSALCGGEVTDEEVGPEQWDLIYSQTDREIEGHLGHGRTVVDASRNFRRAERDHARQIASTMQARSVLIYVDTPEPIARQRWNVNKANPTRRNVSDRGFREIISAMEPPGPDEAALLFHHDDNIADWLSCHSAHFPR